LRFYKFLNGVPAFAGMTTLAFLQKFFYLLSRSPPRCRRHSEFPLERAAEGGLGLVAGALGDGGDRLAALAQRLRGERHAPAREVLDRRLADERGEALGERGARERDLLRERVHRPVAPRIAVQERKRAADLRVAHAGEPATAARRQAVHVAAHG